MHEGPRHLAVFIYGLTGGGAQRRTMTLAGEFAERGHRVDLVVVHPGGPLVRELSPAVRFTVLESRWKRPLRALSRTMNVRGLETLASIPTLAGYLRRERPDVLMSAASHVNLVAVLARQLSRTPVRLVLRTSNDPSGNPKLWPRAERPVRPFLRAAAASWRPLTECSWDRTMWPGTTTTRVLWLGSSPSGAGPDRSLTCWVSSLRGSPKPCPHNGRGGA